MPAPGEMVGWDCRRRHAQKRKAILNHHLPVSLCPIPFQHGEFCCVQRPGFAIAKHTSKIEDFFFPSRQQFLAGEFWAGVQKQRRWRPIGGKLGRCKTMQMGLVAGGDLQLPGLNLAKPLRLKPSAHSLFDAIARQKKWPPISMAATLPPRALRYV